LTFLVELSVKTLVRKLLARTLGAPVLWLGLGVGALCASLGMSYLQAQAEADHALAVRTGPPEAVAIADAVAGQGEAHLLARFDARDAVAISLGAPGARQEWIAVPLFPTGSASPADPLSFGTSSRLRQASGLALFPPGTAGPEALLAEDAATFRGALNGVFVPAEMFALDTTAALAEAGFSLRPDFVAIRPWTEGRAAALAPPPPGPLGRSLFWAGVASIVGALALSLWPERGDRYLNIRPDESERKVVTRSRIVADQHRFNPLVGHDDIRRGAMERLHAAERAQGRTPSSFHTSGSAEKVGGAWVKSRR